MKCPVVGTHTLIEIAPGCYQCPECGAGPQLYWALSEIDMVGSSIGAILVTYCQSADEFHVSQVTWDLDEKGARVPLSFSTLFLATVRNESAAVKHISVPVFSTGERVPLRTMMFNNTYGIKAYQPARHKDMNARSPSRREEGAHSRRRPRK